MRNWIQTLTCVLGTATALWSGTTFGAELRVLKNLYSAAAQELAAQHFFRPKNPATLARYAMRYRPVELLTVKDFAGGWEKSQQVHFADGGIFDQIHQRHQPYKS